MRSHAVKQALQNKRNLKQASMENFCIHTVKGGKSVKRAIRKGIPDESLVSPPTTLGASTIDPFDSLPIKGARLQHLLNNRQSLNPFACRI